MESRYGQKRERPGQAECGPKEPYRYKQMEDWPGKAQWMKINGLHGDIPFEVWSRHVTWEHIMAPLGQKEPCPYEQKEEQKEEWPRQTQEWQEEGWMSVHGPWGLKESLVTGLIQAGINFNDLKPRMFRGCYPPDCHETMLLANIEAMMRQWKLSVEDLKRGTFYSELENGRNLDGTKVSKEEALRIIDQINNDNKKQYNMKPDLEEARLCAQKLQEAIRELDEKLAGEDEDLSEVEEFDEYGYIPPVKNNRMKKEEDELKYGKDQAIN